MNYRKFIPQTLGGSPFNIWNELCKWKFKNLKWIALKLSSPNGLVARKIHGHTMFLSLQDLGLSKELVLRGTREEEEVKILQKELKKGMTVVDIGANMGYYALMEASIVGENGKVYAIEPLPVNFEILNKNIKVNGYSDIVETHRMAISNKKDVLKFYVSDGFNLCTLDPYASKQHPGMFSKTMAVETTTLDDFLRDKPPVDFIRMDIEGYETKVIEGMTKTISQTRPLKLFIEFHHPRSFEEADWALKQLAKLGFKPKIVLTTQGTKRYDVSSMNEILPIIRRIGKALTLLLEKSG